MDREKNKAICRRFIQQILNEGRLSSVRNFVSPDSLHHDLDDMPAPSGLSPERLTDMIGLYRHAFPDLQVDIQDQVAERDQVVTRLRMQGTQKGPLMGIGMTGKAVDINGVRIDRLAEGKITESWFHWDGLGMLQQIGALPVLARNSQATPWTKEVTALPTLKPFPAVPTTTALPRPSAAARLKPAA